MEVINLDIEKCVKSSDSIELLTRDEIKVIVSIFPMSDMTWVRYDPQIREWFCTDWDLYGEDNLFKFRYFNPERDCVDENGVYIRKKIADSIIELFSLYIKDDAEKSDIVPLSLRMARCLQNDGLIDHIAQMYIDNYFLAETGIFDVGKLRVSDYCLV